MTTAILINHRTGYDVTLCDEDTTTDGTLGWFYSDEMPDCEYSRADGTWTVSPRGEFVGLVGEVLYIDGVRQEVPE